MSTGAHDLRELEQDPRLFLYTSLTAGSSHIITATSRMETILKANRIPFQAVDTATDEKARRLWARRAGKRKIPGLVKEGFVIGDLEQVEEWNEFGELKENIGPVPANNAAAPTPKPPVKAAATSSSGATASEKSDATPAQQRIALPGAAEIAARNKPAVTSSPAPATSSPSMADTTKPEATTTAPNEKLRTVKIAGEDHLSAPPSALQSGTASPAEPAPEPTPATLSAIPKSVQQVHSGEDHLSAPPSQVQSGSATPAEPVASPSEAKQETLSAVPKSLQQIEPDVEHLSAPPSQFQSGTATPAEPTDAVAGAPLDSTTSAGSIKAEHRGSEVKEAPRDVVKEIEKSTSISEEPEETEGITKGVGELQVQGGAATQHQNAKDGSEAGKSVED